MLQRDFSFDTGSFQFDLEYLLALKRALKVEDISKSLMNLPAQPTKSAGLHGNPHPQHHCQGSYGGRRGRVLNSSIQNIHIPILLQSGLPGSKFLVPFLQYYLSLPHKIKLEN